MINTKRQAPVSTATLPVLMDVIADRHSTCAAVATVVSHDHGLASRVLGLANSAQFGLPRTVTELPAAVGLLGWSMVQTLAIANSTALLDRAAGMADRQRHALAVAAAARLLAPAAGVRPSDAFAAGLLHDVGELLLLQNSPTEYQAIRTTFEGHGHQLEAEFHAFGCDHALIAAEHLLEWRLPDVIADAVADHHRPGPSSPPTTVVVAAADELVEAEPSRRHALDLLGIDPDESAPLLETIWAESGELAAMLTV